MKKSVSILCVLSLLVVMLASCNSVDTPDHEHKFASEWTKDTDYHWHACTANENCQERGDKAAHDYISDLDDDGNPINVCKVCGYKNDRVSTAPEHEHTFGTEYKYGDNFHWYECTTDGCYETSKSREHQFGTPETSYDKGTLTVTYTCVDCGYQKSEVSKIDAEVDSATEWDEIFGNFNLTNFEMDVYMTLGTESQHNHCIVTEYGIYYHIPTSIEMYIVKVNGEWVGYAKNEYLGAGAKFERIEASQEELEEAYKNYARETVLQISFAENFEKFTYNAETGAYTSSEVIRADAYDNDGTGIYTHLNCFNSVVKISDGKILSIYSDYNFDNSGSDETYRFVYDKIGMAEVAIPQYVIDEANANSQN